MTMSQLQNFIADFVGEKTQSRFGIIGACNIVRFGIIIRKLGMVIELQLQETNLFDVSVWENRRYAMSLFSMNVLSAGGLYDF